MGKESHTSVYYDRDAQCFVGLDSKIQGLKKTFMGIDVDQELSKMGLWLQSSKGKRRKGDIRFILSWLGRSAPRNSQLDIIDSPLTPYIDIYLEDLWKNSQHILEFNTKKMV